MPHELLINYSSKLKRLYRLPDDSEELIPQKKKKGENGQCLMDSNGRFEIMN